MSNEELAEKRLEICRNCPISTNTDYGLRCDSSKYRNKEGEWSYLPKEGMVRGCSCLLEKRVLDPNKHCVVDLW